MTTREKKQTVAVRSPIIKCGERPTLKNLPSLSEQFAQSLDWQDRMDLDDEEITVTELTPSDVEVIELILWSQQSGGGF